MKRAFNRVVVRLAASLLLFVAGCGSREAKPDRDFHTSGSREADQRAEQRIARDQQLKGEGSGKDEGRKAAEKKSLYDRLGGEEGIALIVEDFVNRAVADPRVNWERKGVTKGGWFRRNKSVEWSNTPENGTRMKKHITQFLCTVTGGPPLYEGRDMKEVHGSMHISNPEFDAAIGDLKASLDNLKVPINEQKELLAVVESTRPLVVTKR
jgi:hemoglobin